MSSDTDDYVAPKRVFLDDVPVIDPELGPVPLWKAILWQTANLRRELMARADSAADVRHEEAPPATQPPPLVADAEEAQAKVREIKEAKEQAVLASLDALEKRMDRFEAVRAVRRAEAVLAETEANPQLMLEACDDFKAPFADLAAKALAFTILTAARTGEASGMTFDEIDFDNATWTVPAARMKMNKEHRVPLSDAALDILRAREKARGKKQTFVFESPILQGSKVHRDAAHQPLSSMSMPMVMRRMKAGEFTVHGFRSSARSFWADHGVAFEVAEACLAHVTGNDVVRAYQRSDLLERRRKVMADWAAYLSGATATAKVVSITGRKRR